MRELSLEVIMHAEYSIPEFWQRKGFEDGNRSKFNSDGLDIASMTTERFDVKYGARTADLAFENERKAGGGSLEKRRFMLLLPWCFAF